MLIAVLSDVHSNLAALEAVLSDARLHGALQTWHLGDLVGYGPQPDDVIERLVEARALNVMGNHDAAAVRMLPTTDFNPYARAAVEWTMKRLAAASVDYLRGLPKVTCEGAFTLVLVTLRDPLWEYLDTVEAARAQFAAQQTPWSLFGHTHLPMLIQEAPDGRLQSQSPAHDDRLEPGEGRVCMNPGAVGQPRDGDPRAAYALLETEEPAVTFRRVAYDIAATQRLMRERGLPEALAQRLSHGR